MEVAGLIAQKINRSTNKSISARVKDGKTLCIRFLLGVPAFSSDEDLLKVSNSTIIYARNAKKNIRQYVVTNENKDKDYPYVTNSKFLAVHKDYNISEWLESKEYIITFLRKERQKVFLETKSNIVLEKIGILSKQYDNLTSGVYYTDKVRPWAEPKIKEERPVMVGVIKKIPF